jgi:YggT family protein
MYFLKSIIDIAVVLLLLRLLIAPNEVLFNPIFRLIHRITDVLLTPSKYVARTPFRGIVLTLAALVALRGAVFLGIKPMPFLAGLGISLLDLLQFLFQAYMVIWFVSILSRRRYGGVFMGMVDRALVPFYTVTRNFKISPNRFYLFVFLFLWFTFSCSSILIQSILISSRGFSSSAAVLALAEGPVLVLALFPLPGFFSLVIIVGALLSWVSPDPSNPVVQAIYGISEPLLDPFRRIVPNIGGLDVSPILALLCFQILGTLGQQLINGLVKML